MNSVEDSRTLNALRTLLDRAHLAPPGWLGDVVLEAGNTLEWTVRLYLADPEQQSLIPLPARGLPPGMPHSIDGTLAGRCFRSVVPVLSPTHEPTIWLPIVDGVERLGVLEVALREEDDTSDPTFQERCRLIAHLTGHLIAVKRPYGDDLERIVRRRPRTVASELLHSLLPPLTFACEGLVVSGLLQPFYDVAADAFDYSVVDETAHIAILDATGHDLHGTLLAAIALSAYRSCRRRGRRLLSSAQIMDDLVAEHGDGWRLVTGVLGELDLSSGRFRYLNAGHPPPLLMRAGKVVKELTGGHRVLFGLGEGQGTVAEESLQPGDRIVLYTDGITEARTEQGEFFGVARLVDRLERAAASRQPAPETLRRISLDVLAHQGGVFKDDATLLIAEWGTGDERDLSATRHHEISSTGGQS